MHEASDDDGYDVDDEQSSVVPTVFLVFNFVVEDKYVDRIGYGSFL